MAQVTTPVREDIRQMVVDQLRWDRTVDDKNIMVEVNSNTAILMGSVPTYLDRRAAEIDALECPGIEKVLNLLEIINPVNPELSIMADEEIRSHILQSISWNPVIDASKISVSVRNGIIVLNGTVDAYWKLLRVAELTANVTGVLSIHNHLSVVPTEYFSDEAIAREIQDALARSGEIDLDTVTVNVADGIVVLTGTVPGRLAYQLAQDVVCRTGGVRQFANRLKTK